MYRNWNAELLYVLENNLIDDMTKLYSIDPKAAEDYANRLVSYKRAVYTLQRLSEVR